MGKEVNDLINKIDKIAQKIVVIQIAFCLCVGFLINDLKFPSFIKYFSDMLTISLVYLLCYKLYKKPYLLKDIWHSKRNICIIFFLIIAFFIHTFISFIINHESLILYLWGLRNTFRFFIFFVSCVFFNTNNLFYNIKHILSVLFYFNIVLMIIQKFFYSNITVDQINGIFGVAVGNNNALNAFFCIMLIYFVVDIIRFKVLDKKNMINILLILIISAMSELKIVYIEFFILIIFALIFILKDLPLKKSLSYILILFVMCVASLQLLYKLNPTFSGFFTNPQKIIQYIYSEPYWSDTAHEVLVEETGKIAEPINRFSFFEIIDNGFFNSTEKRIYGLGLGNCDYSSFSFLVSNNYAKYYPINYTWFSSSFCFIETGWVGFALYSMFFILIGYFSFYRILKNKFLHEETLVSGLMSAMAIILLFYGLALRTELSAYLIFYLLSCVSLSIPQKVINERDNLISIIVPVYNVEAYVARCIESLLNQTYKNIEIIIIDDGSTDQSNSICRKYALLDNRIKLFKKENGGLSSARNYGLDVSNGNYIFFVDSDDYISNICIERLINLSLIYDADIVACEYQKVYSKDKIESIKNFNNEVIRQFKNEEIVYDLLNYKTFNIMSCAKLYRKTLFEKIRFPLNLLHEDEFTTPYLFELAKCAVYTSMPYYKYFYRDNSITTSSFTLKRLDSVKAHEERIQYFKNKHGKKLYGIMLYHYWACINQQLGLIKDSKYSDDSIIHELHIKQNYCIKELMNIKSVYLIKVFLRLIIDKIKKK